MDPYLTSYIRINLKLIIDLSIRAKIIKFLLRINHYFGIGDCFLDLTVKAWSMTTTTKNNLDFSKIKKYFYMKEHYSENEKIPHRMVENICK